MFFGVLSYVLMMNVIDIDENECVKFVLWCCDKLSEKFVIVMDVSMCVMIIFGCLSVFLRFVEILENVVMVDVCM